MDIEQKRKGVQHVVGHDKELKEDMPLELFIHSGMKDEGRVYFRK